MCATAAVVVWTGGQADAAQCGKCGVMAIDVSSLARIVSHSLYKAEQKVHQLGRGLNSPKENDCNGARSADRICAEARHSD
jgi:hypothetical protein